MRGFPLLVSAAALALSLSECAPHVTSTARGPSSTSELPSLPKGTMAVAQESKLPSEEPLRPPVDFKWSGDKIAKRAAKPPADPKKGEDDSPSAPWGREDGTDPLSARGSMWGDDIDDAFGGGGLGLSGVGEGGGGIGLGSIGTLGHGAGTGSGAGFGSGAGRLSGAHRSRDTSSSPGFPPPPGGVRSGEWDDNANYIEWKKFLATSSGSGAKSVDVSARRFLVVRDAKGKGVPNCAVKVSGENAQGRDVGDVTLTTIASGRALFFPRMDLPDASRFVAQAECVKGEGSAPSVSFDSIESDQALTLDVGAERVLSKKKTVDVVFVLDTTGSMSEEIAAVTQTIEKVSAVLDKKNVGVRLGLVEYRDRGDDFLVRVHPMTQDVAGFVGETKRVRAGGGGDTPEDVNAGIQVALDEMQWNPDSVARMAFVIGDAPPHLDYPGGASYVDSAKRANHAGIQLFTVAASGMDGMGQVVFRQVAMMTDATNFFVLRGGAGPQSTGGGDPLSSCGGTQTTFRTSDLDKLISGKVEEAIKALDEDPMKIAGLGADVSAKTCAVASNQP